MASQLVNIVRFVDVPPGGSATLPHLLTVDNMRGAENVRPDIVIGDAPGFPAPLVTVDEVNITVTNDTTDVLSINVWCRHLHTHDRFFGSRDNLNLIPQPIIVMPGSSAMVGFAAPVTVRGANNVEGTEATAARSDHEHRLEVQVEDEDVLVSARPTLDFRGVGVTAIDDPGNDRTVITIPGDSDGGAVVADTDYLGTNVQTSGGVFVDTGLLTTVPVAGRYWAIFEGEGTNQSASGVVEIGLSVNSLVLPQANSQRRSQGPAANMRPLITTHDFGVLAPGDIIRCLFKKLSGAGAVEIDRRRLTIFLRQ